MPYKKSCRSSCDPCEPSCCDPYWNNGCDFWVFFIIFLFIILLLAACSQGYRYYYVGTVKTASGKTEQVLVDMNKKSDAVPDPDSALSAHAGGVQEPHLVWIGTDSTYE